MCWTQGSSSQQSKWKELGSAVLVRWVGSQSGSWWEHDPTWSNQQIIVKQLVDRRHDGCYIAKIINPTAGTKQNLHSAFTILFSSHIHLTSEQTWPLVQDLWWSHLFSCLVVQFTSWSTDGDPSKQLKKPRHMFPFNQPWGMNIYCRSSLNSTCCCTELNQKINCL